MKNLFLTLLLCSAFSLHAQIPFEDWEVVFLNNTEIQCGMETVKIDEEFDAPLDPQIWGTYMNYYFPFVSNDNNLYRRLHRNDSEVIFRDENVTIENGKCIITMNEALPGNDTWTAPDDDGNIITVQRDLNSGVISSKQRFRYGTFEITSKNPTADGVYTAFWMHHVQELDITDVAGQTSFFAATYNDYNNDNVNFSGFIGDLDLTVFHNFKTVWTPYSIKWYLDDTDLDDNNIVAEIYKYHNSDNIPLDFECGDLIPAGNYHINPRFLDTEKSMAVVAWLDAKRQCWKETCDDCDPQDEEEDRNCCDIDNNPVTHCGPQFDPAGFETIYEIENIKVTQVEYSEDTYQKLNTKANDMMVSNPAQPAKFLVYGDIELSDVHDNMLEDIKNRYTSNDLAFIVIVGDLFPSGLDKAEAYSIYDQKIRNFMNATGIAVWTVPGNHDVECLECLDLYTSIIGDINWMFLYQGSAFVGVLNAQLTPGYVGPGWSNEVEAFGVPQTTTNDVDAFLKASSYTNLFNFTHVPLVWSNYSCGYYGYMEYYSMLVKRGLTANFAGHIHQYRKEYLCNTGAYEIVIGTAGSNIAGGSNTSNSYKTTQAYCDITFNSWEFPYLDLYTSNNTTSTSTYSLNSAYSFYMDGTGDGNCDCPKWPLYNYKVKPKINFYDENGTCYACIQNLSRTYDDLTVLINDQVVTQNTNLGNGQLCFALEEPSCESKIEVEYVSCESKGDDCGTTKVQFDPNDLQATLEDMILDISECHDGDESSLPYVLIQGNKNMSVSTYIVTPSSTIATNEQMLENDQILVTWDGFLARELVVNVSYEYCGCSLNEEIRIPIPKCTKGNCCPEGSEWNGAHCYFSYYIPDGYEPFIWNNTFYTHPGPNAEDDCPPGSTYDDVNCRFGSFPALYEGFIWNNHFYTHQNCDADPQLCCPYGSTWDGANCKYDISVPDGYDPFISEDNGLYVSPDNNGECPPGSTPTPEGCYLGTTMPEGIDGFIYNGKFYANENCDVANCCPEGTVWNGEICVMELEWEDVIILEDNSIVLEYDPDTDCPDGTTLDDKGEYCLTGLSVPAGFDGAVNGQTIEVVPNCNSCCPEGFEFNGTECIKEVSLDGADINTAGGKVSIRPDCNLFLQSNDCCPEGFYNSGNNCLLQESTDDLTVEFMLSYVSLRTTRANCLDDGRVLVRSSESEKEGTNGDYNTQNEPKLSLLPNPTSGKVFFDYDSDNFQLNKVSIYNATGKLMYKLTQTQIESFEIEKFNALNSGIYFVVFEFEATVISKKIIKL